MRRNPASGELSTAQCWDRLRQASLGRVALSARALPVIIPVQFYVDGRVIVMCMGIDPPFEPALDQVVAAFSVEHIDAETGAGWTVHVQGVLYSPERPADPERCPAGQGLIVRLEAVAVIGWRVQLCPLASPERWPALN